jgi:hypothetical protein
VFQIAQLELTGRHRQWFGLIATERSSTVWFNASEKKKKGKAAAEPATRNRNAAPGNRCISIPFHSMWLHPRRRSRNQTGKARHVILRGVRAARAASPRPLVLSPTTGVAKVQGRQDFDDGQVSRSPKH